MATAKKRELQTKDYFLRGNKTSPDVFSDIKAFEMKLKLIN
jgi:hypothetical protein